MSSLSLVLPAEATHHTPLPPLPCIVSDGTSPAPDLLQQGSVLGGYVGGCDQLVWRALGPTVEVLGSSTGTRVAAWTFGAVFRSTTAKVLSACGVGGCSGAITHIVCGVDRGPEASPRGLLAVLSLASSKIVRAFTFPHPVVSVCVVRGGDAWVDDSTLHPSLRSCSPLLVLATEQPSLHLLDLALDIAGDSVSSDELSPGSLVGLPPLPPRTATPPPSFLQHRMSALRERLHFGATLLEGSVSVGRFFLLGPSDSVLCQLPAAAVQVTALLYIPQLASLAIGYNFGAFQLYNLHTLAIDCASPYEEDVPGVMSFAYQEPENDPRNCVYLWLCRSIDPLSLQDSEPPCDAGAVCTLYSMTYEKREWIEGHGLWYQGLTAIAPRFEFEADGSPCPVQGGGGGEGNPRATVLFTSHTVTRPSPPATPPPLAHCPPSLLLGGPEDEGTSTVSDLSLCLFGWYSRSVDDRGRETTQHFVALFDINQWYQAQMPATAQLFPGRLCPYMSFHRLDRVPCGPQERVLAAAPLTITCITRHMAPTGTSDRDWYPAALSYGVGVLSSSGCAWYRCRSAPQWCLRWLLAQGPAAVLLCPQETLLRCSFAGIMPLSGAAVGDTDSASPRTGSKDERGDRETVLDVCLSQQLLSVLNDCVSEFSDGKFSSVGCTLPSLLQWAWARVTRTKADNDSLLSLLFSRGDCQLTPEQLQRIHHNLTVLGTLRAVLSMCAHHTPETTRHAGGGVGEVGACATVVSLLQQHLTVTLWFQHCQLLPEVDPSLAMDDSNAVPYPAVSLAQIYRNKRREIGALNARLEGSELLLIDQLMIELVKAAGGVIDGWPEAVYPPPSLQALLNIYLLPDPPLPLKHRIVQYLFIDLSSILTDGFVTAVEYLIKFPASAKLSPSIIKLTQAFWLLDQQDYQSAVDLFLDPLVVRTDITVEQHRRIIRALLCQDQASLALTYLEGRAPPHQSPEDAQLHLSVLLACGRVREAYHYQRQHGTATSQQHLLQHLLQGCEHYGRLGDMLQLPLLKSEEAALLQHLKTSDHPHAKEVYTIHCLRNARYSSISCEGPGAVRGSEAQAARSALLRSYSTHFPAPTAPQHDALVSRRSEYSAPQPLSARIRQAAISPNNSRVTDYNKRLAHLTDASSQQSFTPFRSSAQRRRKLEDVDLSKSHCSVLFPSRLLDTTTAGGQRAPGDRLSILATTTPVDKRLSSIRDVSAHIMALLNSPPVTHRPSSRLSAPGANPALGDLSAPPTPQSILKVRSLLQRPSSPCSSVGDLTVPAPRLLTPRQITLVKIPDEDSPSAAALCLTPKHLRFALPTPPLLDASNDATMSSDAASTNVKPAAVSRDVPDGTDSEEHSDLDVQLEPYIHRTSKHESTPSSAGAAQALYEEQDSWEMLSESQLRLNVTSSHHEGEAVTEPSVGAAAGDGVTTAPSFSGVMQRLSQHDANRSEVLAASAVRDLQTPPADDDDDVSDTNEQYYSFDSEDQEHQDVEEQQQQQDVEEQQQDVEEQQQDVEEQQQQQDVEEQQQQQDVEEQQQDEETVNHIQHVEEELAQHRAGEKSLQRRVVEEEQVVEKIVQVEEQEVFEVDEEHPEEVEIEEVLEIQEEVQQVVHQEDFEDTLRISILEQSKSSRSTIEANELSGQKVPREEMRRNSKRKRDAVLVEEQSSQDAFDLDREKQSEAHSTTLVSIEEQDSQDASFVSSANKELELNEISVEDVAECLHEKVLCEAELLFSDSSEDNGGKKQLDTADKVNSANIQTTTTTTTTKRVKEVLPELQLSDSEDSEESSKDRAIKKKKKSSVVSVKTTTTTSSSRKEAKGIVVLPDLIFSDSEEDAVSVKRLPTKSVVNFSTSSVKSASNNKAPKESLPVLLFSDSEEELSSEKRSKMSIEVQLPTHKTCPGSVTHTETLPTLLFSSSEEEEEDLAVQPIKARLNEEPSVEEISSDHKREESEDDSRHVEPATATKRSIADEINTSEQMEVTIATEKSSAVEETVQELDSLEQVKATTTVEQTLISDDVGQELDSLTQVKATTTVEQTLISDDVGQELDTLTQVKATTTVEQTLISDDVGQELDTLTQVKATTTVEQSLISDDVGQELDSLTQVKAPTIVEQSLISDDVGQELDSLTQVKATTTVEQTLISDDVGQELDSLTQVKATTTVEQTLISDDVVQELDSLEQVKATTTVEQTLISDDVVQELDSLTQVKATTIVEQSLISDDVGQELDSLEQVKATTTMEKKSTDDESVQEMNSSEQVNHTITTEKSLPSNETIDEQSASHIIEETTAFHKDSSSNIPIISVSSACSMIDNTNHVRVEENTSSKIVDTSFSSPLKRRSVKPLDILDSPSRPSLHALELIQASIVPAADEASESPVDRRRGKSEDRTPSKARSSFGRKLEISKLMTEGVTPIRAASRARATSEEPKSVRSDTPAKSALRGIQLIGLSTVNIIEPPEKFADIVTPVTPLRRSSRRLGGESPIIARDVGIKGEILQTPSRLGQELSLLQKIEENDSNESNALSSVDIPVASQALTVDKETIATIKLDGRKKTATDAVKSDMDGFESDSSLGLLATMSPSRRGRRSSLGGVTDQSTPSTPVRRSSRRSVTPSKFGTPVLDPVPEESTPKKAKRTPLKSAIKELLEEDKSVTPKKSVVASEELKTPASGARRGRRKSVEPGNLTPSRSGAPDSNVVSTPTPGRRTRRKSITSLEPLIEETSEVEEISSTDTSPSSGKSSKKSKRLSIAPELPPIVEDPEFPKTETPVKGRRSRQSSPVSVSEGRSTDSDADTSSQTLLKSATKKATKQIISTSTSKKGTPLKTDSTEMHGETVATVAGRGRRRSSMAPSFAGDATTRNIRLRKSISSMKVTTDLDTTSSDDGRRRRRSSRPSPALSSSVVYHTPKAYQSSSDEEEEEEDENQEDPYPPSLPEGQSEDEAVFDKAESIPRGIKLRPLKMATPKGGGGPRRSLSHAPNYVIDHGRKMHVGLKRGRQSMKIAVESEEVRHAITSKSTTDGRASQRTLQLSLDSDAESTYLPSEDDDAERRTKRPRRSPSTAGGRRDE